VRKRIIQIAALQTERRTDGSVDPGAIPAHRERPLPPQSTYCGPEGDLGVAAAGTHPRRCRGATPADLCASDQGQVAPPPRVELMSPDEFSDIPDEFRAMTQAQLELVARVTGQTPDQARRIAYARVELLRRDREYAEQEEQSRREFETNLQATRQQFEEELAQRQMDHAAALAKEQLDTAQAAARAAKMAAWAAIAAAIGAITQVVIAIVK
jgi:hypothetical protein